ncbi:hypothetical protein [Dermatophilus congolensis]|uniref:hypothetical protein n=1 Tax=Dermatophilus congolensis TaxID=1863 RepID=UPI001AAF5A8F|nr:hypothetical protein [Dermatophilus congolensis]MBO3142497.1 hypothetical protein [Dermatophilus congolensis]MBO3151486.1 hypothetical protein [Dermatophilus congolensis]MBO3161510.1 hypothetical protein [Dermatophilus congolensis]MBO3162772.1 hypothetical protein [Dermatophilus congolensis]MBO3176326.1 hypothetical protein [Dermatophilus congolensis]
MSDVTEPSELEQLRVLVQDLSARVERLESRIAELHDPEEISEDVILAISAAVAAALGKRATIKQIHFASKSGSGWADQGRSDIQHSHTIRPQSSNVR